MVRRARRRRRKKNAGTGKPLIGITCEVTKLKPYYSEFDLSCDYRYVRAVLRAGGNPVLLPVNPFSYDVRQILDRMDGLVIVGGADIHPSFYGEKSNRKIRPAYRGRTYFEIDLYRQAQKRGIPVLGICHGHQLINVIHGGTLYHDIQSQVRHARNHRSRRNPLHRVEVQPGSLCHRIFSKRSFLVHSSHHQAVKMPGRSVNVSAVAEDGIPEAIEGPKGTFGVQWHPERQEKDPVQMRLFRYFIRLARAKRIASSRP
jgi:putative glutamine amidotransferase